MTLRPPRSTRPDTLFPYTTLFRSPERQEQARGEPDCFAIDLLGGVQNLFGPCRREGVAVDGRPGRLVEIVFAHIFVPGWPHELDAWNGRALFLLHAGPSAGRSEGTRLNSSH